MAEIGRLYDRVTFPPQVIEAAVKELHKGVPDEKLLYAPSLEVRRGASSESFDSFEEFADAYRGGFDYARGIWQCRGGSITVTVSPGYQHSDRAMGTDVSVRHGSRADVLSVLKVFDVAAHDLKVPAPLPPTPPPPQPPPKPRIFIGHGHSPQWRDLKDHLADKHGLDIEAYEIGARAGHAVRDILESMARRSSMALLVFTGEDQDIDGKLHARENVVHELGLFQGTLGFSRAIVLLEEGVEKFSNIEGIQRIDFEKGSIKGTFGDVLATIRREFPSALA